MASRGCERSNAPKTAANVAFANTAYRAIDSNDECLNIAALRAVNETLDEFPIAKHVELKPERPLCR